ncbi:MAG TPA: phosphate acyltransferase PlsX [Capillimicrobium sp.]|nr:phosphate acyltransferase PlsX [Capillimicrobium sp.]
MATVAVDANGADLGPREVAEGAMLAARGGVRVIVYGDASRMGEVSGDVTVVDAPVSIAKAADPASAARSTPEASIVQAARAVADGQADALVSAGSTGAALAAGLFNVKRASGIYRPALAVPVPIPGAPVTLVDVGANADVRAEHLVQFAFMGAALVTLRQGIARPRVALLSNGEEPTRGNGLVIEAHGLLAERTAGSTALEFVGNVEGTQVTTGAADVIVADGFTGNIALKMLEGTSQTLLGAIRDRAMASSRGKLGGILLRPALRGLRDELDPEGPGGAYLLGLRKLGVVPHGRFTRRGFANAIAVAARGVDEDLVGRTIAAMEAAGALRRPPSDRTATVAAE